MYESCQDMSEWLIWDA